MYRITSRDADNTARLASGQGRAGRTWGALGVGAEARGGEPAGVFWAELGRTGQSGAGRTWGALRGGADASGGEPDGGADCSLEPPCCCPAEEASIKASNCAVLIRMISILAFWTGRSLPASSVVSRPVVISAFSNQSVINCRLHTVAPAADVRLHALDAGSTLHGLAEQCIYMASSNVNATSLRPGRQHIHRLYAARQV